MLFIVKKFLQRTSLLVFTYDLCLLLTCNDKIDNAWLSSQTKIHQTLWFLCLGGISNFRIGFMLLNILYLLSGWFSAREIMGFAG